LTSRDAKIEALLGWARENGIRFGDFTAPGKLRAVARIWFPSTTQETIGSYVEATLRVLERERHGI
jgi:hypothetical protein